MTHRDEKVSDFPNLNEMVEMWRNPRTTVGEVMRPVLMAEKATKRPKEVSELIRTMNPEVPHREFVAATHPECLEAILQYIYALEGERHAFLTPSPRL